MNERTSNTRHEETIRPIDPGLRGAPASQALPGSGRTRSGVLVRSGIAAALLVAGFVVFFALPRTVEDTAPSGGAAAPSVVEEANAPERPPPLTPEEREALRSRSQTDLARLLSQRERLEARSVEIWGGEEWRRYQALADAGDDAYLADDFAAALEHYAQASELGFELLDRSASILTSSLEQGHAAIEAGDAELALEHFDRVLAIEPQHGDAKFGRGRAENLPAVLELVDRAEELVELDDLEGAADAYRRALELDSIWDPAITGLAAVEAEIGERRFERLLTEGYAALADGEYDEALGHFEAVLRMRPGTPEALDGIVQAEEGIELNRIALARVRALAFERRELWDQAIAQYEAALDTDPTLEYAIEGLERSRRRLDLDAKLENLVDNPTLLFDDSVIEQAHVLLDQAAGVAEPGPRLNEQTSRLARLMELATTPLPVTIESDALTEVTLYRVGELGAFTSLELELEPGNYTAIGSRSGYRDVRTTFTVLPGRELEPIRVVCVEPI